MLLLTAGALLKYADIHANFSYILVSDKIRKKLCAKNLYVWKISVWKISHGKSLYGKTFCFGCKEKVKGSLKLFGKKCGQELDCSENTLIEFIRGLLYGR